MVPPARIGAPRLHSFIVLLFGLFVVAGGIAVRGTLAGTTKINCLLLFIGTFLASWIGTTGAAMLMIRPLIRANAWRKNKVHLMVFFIFLVANIGGCLTPLGDPPLFMGFQRGVPFTWTFHLLPILVLNLVLMFALFAFLDKHFYNKEVKEGRTPLDLIDENDKQPLRLEGAHNLIFIVLIIIGVLANGLLPDMFPLSPMVLACTFTTKSSSPMPHWQKSSSSSSQPSSPSRRRRRRRGNSTNSRMPLSWKSLSCSSAFSSP